MVLPLTDCPNSEFDNPQKSDLIIVDKDNKQIFVCKLVVCTFSQVLDEKLSNNIQVRSLLTLDGDSKPYSYMQMMPPLPKLHLNEDDPKHLYEMLKFSYTETYPFDLPVQDGLDGIRIQKHIDMYNLGTKYKMAALESYAAKAFSENLPQFGTLVLLETVAWVYLMPEPKIFTDILIQHIGHRHREVMLPDSRARSVFFDLLKNIPGFEHDMFVRFFVKGATALCKFCRLETELGDICRDCDQWLNDMFGEQGLVNDNPNGALIPNYVPFNNGGDGGHGG